MAKIETPEAYALRAKEVLAFINEMKPTAIEPFAAIIGQKRVDTIKALIGTGVIMKCVDTGRYFVPSMATAA